MGVKNTLKFNFMMGALATSLALSACSSSGSGKNEGEEASLDEATDAIAQTDPAPASGAELAASLDAGAPAADTLPPPVDGATAEASPPTPAGDLGSLEQLAGAAPASDTPPAMDPPPAMDQLPVAGVTPPAKETVAALEPAVIAAPPANNSNSGQFTQYSVQSGDTLMKIAFETYGDVYQWRKIYEDNRERIKDPNRIPSGTQLKLDQPSSAVTISRNGDKYQIRPGDTLGAIADNIYGKREKWKQIWENNKQLIKNPNRIFAGFYLYYTMTPEERTEAEQMRRVINKAPPLAGNSQAPQAAGGNVARAPAAIAEPASMPPVASGAK